MGSWASTLGPRSIAGGMGYPGFKCLGLGPILQPAPRMSYTAAGYAKGGSYRFHYPDGNATDRPPARSAR